MRLEKLENELGAQYQSIAAVVPESIGRFSAAPGEALKAFLPTKAAVSKGAVAIAVASVGAVVLGSVLRGHSPSAGLEAMTKGIPWLQKRRFGRSRASDAARVGSIIGHVVIGSLLLAGLEGTFGNKLTKSRVGRGLLTSISAFGLDRLLLGQRFIDALDRVIGPSGTAFTYGAIGAAYALASKGPPARDPSGGDISAGVPAM